MHGRHFVGWMGAAQYAWRSRTKLLAEGRARDLRSDIIRSATRIAGGASAQTYSGWTSSTGNPSTVNWSRSLEASPTTTQTIRARSIAARAAASSCCADMAR